MYRSIRAVAWAAVVFVGVIGCGTNANRSAEVTGKVTYKGQPVTGGMMTIHVGSTGYPAGLNSNGEFTASQIPEGEATVTVDTEALNPKTPKYGGGKVPDSRPPEAGSATPKGSYVKIPVKYKKKDTSDAKITLKGGKQEVTVELKD